MLVFTLAKICIQLIFCRSDMVPSICVHVCEWVSSMSEQVLFDIFNWDHSASLTLSPFCIHISLSLSRSLSLDHSLSLSITLSPSSSFIILTNDECQMTMSLTNDHRTANKTHECEHRNRFAYWFFPLKWMWFESMLLLLHPKFILIGRRVNCCGLVKNISRFDLNRTPYD